MSDLRLVIFDCDGTLVDSQAAIGQSMELAYQMVGLDYPGHDAVKKVVGLSLHDAATFLLAENERHLAEDLVGHYRRAFAELRATDAVYEPLFPAVRETLEILHGKNILLGIATGKSLKGLHKTLEGHGLLDFFTTLQSADHHPGKPNPSMLKTALSETGAEPSKTLFVGDTTFDVEMGKSAGIATLGVDWGYHEPALLLEAGARAVLSGMDELVHHALRL